MLDIMLFFINLFHQPIRFKQDGDDFAIVRNVIKGKCASFAVFEPLLGRLVAADVEIPSRFWNILKTLLLVYPHAATFVFWPVNYVAARSVELGMFCRWHFRHQVKLAQLTADSCQTVKLLSRFRIWNAWEVNF